ncbi:MULTISPECIES: ATP-grasp domain-containing protein [unclassified Leifsonia]|uniref:ATP-grasp domain-containing protein n=1 Tax=unclassified Leifsonia TaxID=2663824 RepID=UPI0008A742BD|nr:MULTISPECIES: ATP-grasp domain-containing protein [unclassified Leifsonia]SEH75554.1 carbamoyl-phosphate synthase large subunit [Leifsonia sp. CL154]SFL37016.1 carbamoyl-phosphate synthase large subunit [Leifsonia sp. CL147]
MTDSRTRVLVTGAGGPAGVAVIRSLLARDDVDVFAADMDGWASGLYLVPEDRRRIVPAGRSDGFVDALIGMCRDDAIQVLFSTVDVELPGLAARRTELEAVGTQLAAPSHDTLVTCLDKFALVQRVGSRAAVPETRLLNREGAGADWTFPVIIKPRSGAGSRGVRLIADRGELEALGTDESIIIQENLPGEEFSVDVLAGLDGEVIAAVPRSRERVDSGVSIAGRTVRRPELSDTAAAVARAIGLTGVANVQLRYSAAGIPALLEVNPRFPGAMPLTIAAGVDMPSLLLDLVLGRPVPSAVDFAELANVRFLEDVFLSPADVLVSENAAHAEGFEE